MNRLMAASLNAALVFAIALAPQFAHAQSAYCFLGGGGSLNAAPNSVILKATTPSNSFTHYRCTAVCVVQFTDGTSANVSMQGETYGGVRDYSVSVRGLTKPASGVSGNASCQGYET